MGFRKECYMQVRALRKLLTTHKDQAGIVNAAFQSQKQYTPSPSTNKELSKDYKIGSEDTLSKARDCLSKIEDPLWKQVCDDIINMMGPASLLKIWDSLLGEICFHSQSIEVFCKTKETAHFIQQYDFVILGSLHIYLPSIKTLRISVRD